MSTDDDSGVATGAWRQEWVMAASSLLARGRRGPVPDAGSRRFAVPEGDEYLAKRVGGGARNAGGHGPEDVGLRRGPGSQGGVHGLDPGIRQTDPRAAPVVVVALPLDVAGLLESVQQRA